MGHVISAERVAMDNKKIRSVQEWPILSSVKKVRGFLGLTGYYRKFIRRYGLIAKRLTELLKKNNFGWNSDAQKSFEQFKKAISTAPIL